MKVWLLTSGKWPEDYSVDGVFLDRELAERWLTARRSWENEHAFESTAELEEFYLSTDEPPDDIG